MSREGPMYVYFFVIFQHPSQHNISKCTTSCGHEFAIQHIIIIKTVSSSVSEAQPKRERCDLKIILET